MNGVLTITVDTSDVTNMVNHYQRELPKMAERMPRKIASMYALTYWEQLPLAKGGPKGLGIGKFTGESEESLRSQVKSPIRFGKSSYGVVAPNQLMMLDSMSTHIVHLNRGSQLMAWAKKKAPWAIKRGFITVHQHPWIRSANIKAGMKINKIIKAELKSLRRR